MLGFMKNKLAETISDAHKRFDGRTDVLEGMCAAIVRLAIADGEVEESEIMKGLELMTKHAVIGTAFSATQIEACLMKMNAHANNGFSGKLALKTEFNEMIAKLSTEDREPVGMLLLDVAFADGELEAAEEPVLNDMFTALGLKSYKSYLA